ATLAAAFALLYALFIALGDNLLIAVLLAIPFGLVLAGHGFAVMHDGNHAAYSDDKRANRAMGLVLDLLGGSSYLWRHKHNHIHHSHPNIVGADDDLEAGWFLRMAPGQPHVGLHRWQHIYMWPLYGLISIKWHLADDFNQLRAGQINGVPFAPPRGRDLAELVIGKILFFGWALALPIALVGLVPALVFYVVSQFVLGVVLSTLHQSSLGSLWVLVPTKLHPLWYTIYLPVFFWISAVAVGLAMTIVESTLSSKAFKRGLELPLLAALGKAAAVVLCIYLAAKAADLVARGAWPLLFQPSLEAAAYWTEIGLGVIVPAILFMLPGVRQRPWLLFTAAMMVVVFGIVMNRLNVSLTGLLAYTGLIYTPAWTEIAVSVALVTLGVIAFGLIAKYLPVFPDENEHHA
ncbi:MAG: fatty acid desaturase, partial [Caldilineaceae bacterium]|nr:fatty acid desaturase [Caldilineaceae bacterium]